MPSLHSAALRHKHQCDLFESSCSLVNSCYSIREFTTPKHFEFSPGLPANFDLPTAHKIGKKGKRFKMQFHTWIQLTSMKTYENHWKPTLGVPKLFITREWYRGINCATGTRRCVYSVLCPVATFCNMYQYVAFACVCGMRSQCGLQHERVLAGSRKSRCQRCCNDALQSPSREWSWTSQATLSQRARDTKSTGKDCKVKYVCMYIIYIYIMYVILFWMYTYIVHDDYMCMCCFLVNILHDLK